MKYSLIKQHRHNTRGIRRPICYYFCFVCRQPAKYIIENTKQAREKMNDRRNEGKSISAKIGNNQLQKEERNKAHSHTTIQIRRAGRMNNNIKRFTVIVYPSSFSLPLYTHTQWPNWLILVSWGSLFRFLIQPGPNNSICSNWGLLFWRIFFGSLLGCTRDDNIMHKQFIVSTYGFVEILCGRKILYSPILPYRPEGLFMEII